MEKEPVLKYKSGEVGNYDIYLTLEEGKLLEVTLHSRLDDSVSSTTLTNDIMPPSCKNLFESVDDLYRHISHLLLLPKTDLLAVSDIGQVKICEMMDRKGKQVRVECEFNCEKVPQSQLSRFYLRIIRQLKQQKTLHNPIVDLKEEFKTAQGQYNGGRLFLTVDMINNPYIAYFNKFQQEVTIQQFNRTRLKLYFNETIPKGASFITLRTLNLKCNAFALGIIDQDEDRKISKSPYSFAFEYFTGELKDSGREKTKSEARWRRGAGKATEDLRSALIRMEVNTGEQTIRWFCNGYLVGETIISNYLITKRLTPYISCKHQGDRFQINPK